MPNNDKMDWPTLRASCCFRIDFGIERRPANALNVEIMTPLSRCRQKLPEHWTGTGASALRWLGSGGSALVFGHCSRPCPAMDEGGDEEVEAGVSSLGMAKFDDVVTKVTQRIREGRVLLSERLRAGKKRAISVGPYATATSTKRQYALCALPAMPDMNDCIFNSSADRIAREFVRLVGVDEAQNSLVRESRKRVG